MQQVNKCAAFCTRKIFYFQCGFHMKTRLLRINWSAVLQHHSNIDIAQWIQVIQHLNLMADF